MAIPVSEIKSAIEQFNAKTADVSFNLGVDRIFLRKYGENATISCNDSCIIIEEGNTKALMDINSITYLEVTTINK